MHSHAHGKQDRVAQEPGGRVLFVHGLILPEEPREIVVTKLVTRSLDRITKGQFIPVTV